MPIIYLSIIYDIYNLLSIIPHLCIIYHIKAIVFLLLITDHFSIIYKSIIHLFLFIIYLLSIICLHHLFDTYHIYIYVSIYLSAIILYSSSRDLFHIYLI